MPPPAKRSSFSSPAGGSTTGTIIARRAVRSTRAGRRSLLVPTGRLELPRVTPLPPQDSVSTNFTTSACSLLRHLARLRTRWRALGRRLRGFAGRRRTGRRGHFVRLRGHFLDDALLHHALGRALRGRIPCEAEARRKKDRRQNRRRA